MKVEMKEITPRSVDFSRWYTDVVLKAELADYAPVRGCMVIRPYGYAIWELLQRELDARIKALGHENAYFPLFIPRSLLEKEAEHVEGFSPEVAWVTRGGDEELSEWLAVRPTSETIMYAMFARWIHSYRDLPLLINQWANVVRWEKTTRPFLRTLEFLWQEGHTVHATEQEAEEEALRILKMYETFLREVLAIPVVAGRKTDREKFPGALRTYTVEAMMYDGKALQAGTSHNLGTHFSRAFGIQFLDEKGQQRYAWQTSWGVSTRLVGALIMTHGDDAGLRLPPRVAPWQVVLIPIYFSDAERKEIVEAIHQLAGQLEGLRVRVDDRAEHTPGWKFHEYELRGVPVRVELGPRDLKNQQAVLVRRDTREKEAVSWRELPQRVRALLEDIQGALLKEAEERFWARVHDVETREELARVVEEGWARAGWCGDEACEEAIQEATGATARAIPLEEEEKEGNCVWCGRKAVARVFFARAY